MGWNVRGLYPPGLVINNSFQEIDQGIREMKRLNWLCLLLLVTHPIVGNTEPDSSVKYLMNEPVTMFDWGLYRLSAFAKLIAIGQSRRGEGKVIVTNVGYNWSKNRINITIAVYPNADSLKKHNLRDLCTTVVKKYKTALGYKDTGRYKKMFGIQRFFKHEGFKKNNEPKGLTEDLDNITYINVKIHAISSESKKYEEKTECVSNLSEDNIDFVDLKNTPR
jgi:hypothetical protein